jgi:protein-S-isoprenylcysteine O-methyltransferase Ste14
MGIMQLIGVGHRILATTVPFAAVGVAANLVWPSVFRIGLGATGRVAGIVLLASGFALYLASLIQVLVNVPRGTLSTTGPFAVVRHPLYCAVALLVIPSIGLLLDSWLGFVLGAVMYLATRHFRGVEETHLAATFGDAYRAYRARVLLPWV